MSEDLKSKTCTPCRGGIPPLTKAEAETYLQRTPAWSLEDGGRRLSRRFAFGNFRDAMRFAVEVGELAETEGHHPELAFGWGWATVVWYTHKIAGLHENDFIMAAKTDALLPP